MKKTAVILAWMPLSAFAQSVSPDVVSSSGNSFTDGTSQLDWTLGETVTADLTSGTDQLTQGFHQPELVVTAISSRQEISVNVYPNPTVGLVNVEFTDLAEECTIEVYDLYAKLLDKKTVSGAKAAQLKMDHYAAGNYMLIVTRNNKQSRFQVTKTN